MDLIQAVEALARPWAAVYEREASRKELRRLKEKAHAKGNKAAGRDDPYPILLFLAFLKSEKVQTYLREVAEDEAANPSALDPADQGPCVRVSHNVEWRDAKLCGVKDGIFDVYIFDGGGGGGPARTTMAFIHPEDQPLAGQFMAEHDAAWTNRPSAPPDGADYFSIH